VFVSGDRSSFRVGSRVESRVFRGSPSILVWSIMAQKGKNDDLSASAGRRLRRRRARVESPQAAFLAAEAVQGVNGAGRVRGGLGSTGSGGCSFRPYRPFCG